MGHSVHSWTVYNVPVISELSSFDVKPSLKKWSSVVLYASCVAVGLSLAATFPIAELRRFLSLTSSSLFVHRPDVPERPPLPRSAGGAGKEGSGRG